MIAIVVSRADAASVRIGEQLLELADWSAHEDPDCPDAEGGGTYYCLETGTGTAETDNEAFELRTFEEWHLELEDADEPFADADPDLLVFASRHSGETGPLLTAHFTGNFGPAEFGGRDGELAPASPVAHKRLLDRFREYAPEGYDVGMECTHHGPTSLAVPSMFAELGSGQEQWEDDAGARAVARSILDLRFEFDLELDEERSRRGRSIVAFGGGHYVPRPERIVWETPWAVGHIGADWCLEAMGAPDPDVIEQAFEQSDAELAVIDGEYPTLESTIEEVGYRVVSERWLREVGSVPLALVDRLESDLLGVEEGLRFGEPASDYDPDDDGDGDGEYDYDYDVLALPTEMVEAARSVDASAVREAVEAHALAFETEENGTRVDGRAAFVPEERESLVDALVAILEREYEVRHESDAVVIQERTFDPEKAATLGIPEGPAFGKLATGEAVEVDGRTIDPEAVHTERVRSLPRSPR